MDLENRVFRWKIPNYALLLFALAAVIHVYLRMTLICYTMVDRILDLIDNLASLFPSQEI